MRKHDKEPRPRNVRLTGNRGQQRLHLAGPQEAMVDGYQDLLGIVRRAFGG
jgi:hypothetical protein